MVLVEFVAREYSVGNWLVSVLGCSRYGVDAYGVTDAIDYIDIPLVGEVATSTV